LRRLVSGRRLLFFNNIAVAARYAQNTYGCERVLIIDWDFHHGNGTEWVFYDDPSVFYFSTHALYTYPMTGFPNRTGKAKGKGFNLNVPLQPGAGDKEIIAAWHTQLLPALQKQKFNPDLILISAGFDSRKDDYLGNFTISDKGFTRLTELILQLADTHCSGRVISLLEGGYNPAGQARGVYAHLKTLHSHCKVQNIVA
jgi:acetoin utilization deacetylase AcuC-like enzyme